LTGLALVPALWEVLGVVANARGIILFRSEITTRPTSYAAEVLYQLHGGRQSVLRFRPLPYVQWYVVRQGWLLAALLLLGLIQAARERSERWLVPAALVLVPYVVYMFAPFIVPRNLDTAIPFAVLLSAAGLVWLVDRVRRWPAAARMIGSAGRDGTRAVPYEAVPHEGPPVLGRDLLPSALNTSENRSGGRSWLIVTTLVLILLGCIHVWPLSDAHSGFALAAKYVLEHKSQGALVENEVMLFYLRDPGRGCDAPRLPKTVASLASDARRGTDYAVIDRYSWPLASYLSRHAHLVARYPAVSTSSGGEDLIASENGAPPLALPPERVDVYAIHSIRYLVPGLTTPERCSLDSLG
jgi:hypothetical protein